MKTHDLSTPQINNHKLNYVLKLISDRRKLPLITKSRLRKISDSSLREAYLELVKDLMKDERNKQMQITDWERMLSAQIKEYTRLEFWTTCWIGNINVDFFFPNLKFDEYQGLAIEVNGSYHHTGIQIIKDEYRTHILNGMGIYVIAIENADIEKGTSSKVIEELLRWERLDSKAKKRLERRVYLKTILDHSKRIRINELRLASLVLDAFGPELISSVGEEA